MPAGENFGLGMALKKPGPGKIMKRSGRKKYWSAYVTKHSFALALEPGVFTWRDPKKIARSLKRSAEESTRRKAGPFQSAMSMLNFYINRAGKNLPPSRKRILERAKVELRMLFKKSGRAAEKLQTRHPDANIRPYP